MAGSSSCFQYEPLAEPSKQIRLLRFLSPVGSYDLAFKMETFSLQSAPSFVAISYTWGEPLPVKTIFVNGGSHDVRTNSHYALWQTGLHRSEERFYCWIDTVCIDQDDLREKSAQVSFMGDIYASANKVYSCISPDDFQASRLLQTLIDLVKWEQNVSEYPPPVCEVQRIILDHWPLEGEEHMSTLALDRFLAAFEALGNRAYWRRIWIIPEVYLARSQYLLCGCTLVHATEITMSLQLKGLLTQVFAHRLRAHLDDLFWRSPMEKVLAHSPQGRRELGASDRLPIAHAITTFADQICTDPRDRLYALLRITEWPLNSQPLVPDYGSSEMQLFVSFVQRMYHARELGHQDWLALMDLVDGLGMSFTNLQMASLIARRQKPILTDTYQDLPPSKSHLYDLKEIEVRATNTGWAVLGNGEDGSLTLVNDLAESVPRHTVDINVEPERKRRILKGARRIFFKNQVVGGICAEAQPGDLLVKPLLQAPISLVARPMDRSGLCRIVGYAWLESRQEWYHSTAQYWQPSTPSDQYATVHLDSEDLLLYLVCAVQAREDDSLPANLLSLRAACYHERSRVVVSGSHASELIGPTHREPPMSTTRRTASYLLTALKSISPMKLRRESKSVHETAATEALWVVRSI